MPTLLPPFVRRARLFSPGLLAPLAAPHEAAQNPTVILNSGAVAPGGRAGALFIPTAFTNRAPSIGSTGQIAFFAQMNARGAR